MRNRTKVILTGMVAALVLSLGIGVASALRSIRINNVPPGTEIFASSKLTFHGVGDAGNALICDVTLLRTISTLIPKRTGVLFGRVTGVAIDRGRNVEPNNQEHCARTGGVLEILGIIILRGTHRELGNGVLLYRLTAPELDRLWKLIYDRFQGRLPTIEGIDFHIEKVLFELRFNTIIGLCAGLWEGNAFGLIAIERETIVRAQAVTERTSLRKISGGFACPETSTFEGNFAVEPTNLTISLL